MNPLPGAAAARAVEPRLHQDDHGRRREDAKRLSQDSERQAAARRPDGAHGRCGPHGYKTWKELGITVDEYGIGHANPNDPSRDKNAVPIRKFHAARVADLAKRLAAIPEGNGTMLDNTVQGLDDDHPKPFVQTCLSESWLRVRRAGLFQRSREPGQRRS